MRSMAKRERTFLVIGCGSIGRRHLANLRKLKAGEVWVVDTDLTRARAAARDHGATGFYDIRGALAARPDVALIATPTNLHVKLALAAAAKDCHLFIEKPLSHTLASVPALVRLVRKNRLITLVGCNMRFHPSVRKVKEILDDGSIGSPLAARIEVGQYLPDWHPEEDYRKSYSARRAAGGGVVLDAIHEIDYSMWMFGDVKRVACLTKRTGTIDIETEDLATILLEFRDGTLGQVHLDYLQRTYSRSCQVIGTEGTVKWDWVEGRVRLFRAATGKWQDHPLPPRWEVNQMYQDEMAHFMGCLDGKETTSLDVAGAAKVLKVALAAKRSSARGSFVRIPE